MEVLTKHVHNQNYDFQTTPRKDQVNEKDISDDLQLDHLKPSGALFLSLHLRHAGKGC